MEEDPVFRSAISALRSVIRRHYGWSLSSELSGDPASCRLHDDSDRVQPALTALQIALTESLISRGVLPGWRWIAVHGARRLLRIAPGW